MYTYTHTLDVCSSLVFATCSEIWTHILLTTQSFNKIFHCIHNHAVMGEASILNMILNAIKFLFDSFRINKYQLSEWSPIHWKKDTFSTLTLFVQKLQIENYYHVRSSFLFFSLTSKNCLPESCSTALHWWCLLSGIHWIRIVGLTESLWSSLDGSRGSS